MHNKRNNVNITVGKETLCITEWGRRTGVSHQAISARINKYGWDPVDAAVTPALNYGNHKSKTKGHIK